MHRRVISFLTTAVAVGALVIGPVASANAIGQVMFLHESTPAPTESTIDVGWNAVKGASASAAGGVKDSGYRVLTALTDPTAASYVKVRTL